MTYSIDMPSMGPAFQHFEVNKWFVSLGDNITPGDPILSLYVSPDHRTERLSWRQRRSLGKRGVTESDVERAEVVIYSREPGALIAVAAGEGAVIRPGEQLGITSNPAGGTGHFAVRAAISEEKRNG